MSAKRLVMYCARWKSAYCLVEMRSAVVIFKTRCSVLPSFTDGDTADGDGNTHCPGDNISVPLSATGEDVVPSVEGVITALQTATESQYSRRAFSAPCSNRIGVKHGSRLAQGK